MKNNIYLPPESIPEPIYKGGPFEEYTKSEEKYIQDVISYAKNYGSGKYKGKAVLFPVGDGRAIYVIFDKKTLLHICVGDCWSSPLAEYMPMKELEKIAREYSFNPFLKKVSKEV